MVKVRTGYVANIAGGMLLGFLLGGMVVASAVILPLIYIVAGGGVGAIIGGTFGGIWVFRKRQASRKASGKDAKIR